MVSAIGSFILSVRMFFFSLYFIPNNILPKNLFLLSVLIEKPIAAKSIEDTIGTQIRLYNQ